MARRAAAVIAPAVVILTGCGAVEPTVAATPSPAGVALTARAIAAVTAERLSPDYTIARATPATPEDPDGHLGADLRYDPSRDGEGSLVRVTASPATSHRTCAGLDSCVALAPDGGDPVFLIWQTEVPEEDPGIVMVWVNRPAETERLLLAGPKITGDPRALPLRFAVDELRAVVVDPRLRLRTTPEAVAAGERLPGWK